MSRRKKAKRLKLPYHGPPSRLAGAPHAAEPRGDPAAMGTPTQRREERRRFIEYEFGMLAPLVGPLGFTPDLVRADPVEQTMTLLYRVPGSTHAPERPSAPTPIEAAPPFPAQADEPMLTWLARQGERPDPA